MPANVPFPAYQSSTGVPDTGPGGFWWKGYWIPAGTSWLAAVGSQYGFREGSGQKIWASRPGPSWRKEQFFQAAAAYQTFTTWGLLESVAPIAAEFAPAIPSVGVTAAGYTLAISGGIAEQKWIGRHAGVEALTAWKAGAWIGGSTRGLFEVGYYLYDVLKPAIRLARAAEPYIEAASRVVSELQLFADKVTLAERGLRAAARRVLISYYTMPSRYWSKLYHAGYEFGDWINYLSRPLW